MQESEKYLKSLIAMGENQELDFKFEISDARKIARTLSAFSNTDGGRLLIGVKDNGKISGIRSEEEYYMVESAASLFCKPEIRFESFRHVVEGKHILEVYIPPVEKKPVYARDERQRWMAYVRVEDENILASVVQLRVWKEEHRSEGEILEFTREHRILLQTPGLTGGASLAQLQKDSGMQRQKLVSLLTALVRFDVMEIRIREGESIFGLKERPGAGSADNQ